MYKKSKAKYIPRLPMPMGQNPFRYLSFMPKEVPNKILSKIDHPEAPVSPC